MEVIQKTIMADGIKLQIEDWSKDYTFMNKDSTLVAYPVAKESLDNFMIKRGKTFRLQINFENKEKASMAYDNLSSGCACLKEYVSKFNHKKYINCI